MTKSVENRLYLKKKLFRFQYHAGISMSKHLNDYNKILANLQILEVDISSEYKALLLLNPLLDTYDHLITTLLYRKDEIKFDYVLNALNNNEYRKKVMQAQRDTITEALIVKGMSNDKKLDKDEYNYCRKKGVLKERLSFVAEQGQEGF